jgi:hypothetical protein
VHGCLCMGASVQRLRLILASSWHSIGPIVACRWGALMIGAVVFDDNSAG